LQVLFPARGLKLFEVKTYFHVFLKLQVLFPARGLKPIH
jgi:hypothetical protein